MRNLIVFLLLAIILFSCDGGKRKHAKDSFIIHGKISNADQKKIILQKLTYQEIISVDSSILNKEGDFMFTVKPQEKEIYLLRKDANHYISIIAEKGEEILFETDYESFEKTYTLKGSPESKLLLELNNHLQPNLRKLDSIGKIWKSSINNANRVAVKKNIDSCYIQILADQRAFQLNFIIKNSSSLAALIALYQPLNREPVIYEEKDFAVFEKVSTNLMKALPNNSHAINFAKRIKQRKMLELEKKLTEKETNPNKH
ncbi:MAG: DUF4369 domain-containing protein [Bacteroidetes bacterium]|nr:DUF4369 domain-containing protein [Bacteroidota bacterium]